MAITIETLQKFSGGKLLLIDDDSEKEFTVVSIDLEYDDNDLSGLDKFIAKLIAHGGETKTMLLPLLRDWRFDKLITNCIKAYGIFLYKNNPA